MPLIDTIKQMQQQGITDENIVQSLREQGFAAKEIDDALSQSNIKAAVYEEPGQNSIINNAPSPMEMQPSVMTQDISQDQGMPQSVYPGYQQYPQYQAQEAYYQPPVAASNEMITEISEQIVSEKISEIKKTLSKLTEFKTLMESRVASMDERLKRIESTIDKLQSSILGKVAGYAESIQDVKQELNGMQESFSKVINPLMDRERGAGTTETTEKQNERQEQKEQPRKKSKNKPDFEDFLR